MTFRALASFWILFQHRAELAGATPGLAHGGTALRTKHAPLDIVLALAVSHTQPARTLTVINADVPRRVESHSRGTVAAVASWRVYADTPNAVTSSVAVALVNVFAGTGVRVVSVARRTGALVAPWGVPAESILAKQQVDLAFVYV